MNAKEAIEYIHSTLLFGSKLGIENIRHLLSLLDNPQEKLRFVHIAGTNGKGSTAAVTAEILIKAGYKVGLYTSPYIQRFHERIQVNHVPISDEALGRITAVVKEQCTAMAEAGMQHPTEFEIVTVIGMLYFLEQGCDVVVLEVGLGGTLDATNVIPPPLCCVITSISFDHMQYLGDTIDKIAAEKCGIIKKGCDVVVYAQQEDAFWPVYESRVQEEGAISHPCAQPRIKESTLEGTVFDYKEYDGLTLGLLGAHQAANAACALEVVEVLRQKGFSISRQAVYEGVKAARWVGRFQKLGDKPLFFIDGAHNVSGMASFAAACNLYLKDKKRIYIMGMLRDKEHEKCVSLIAPSASHLIAVDVPNPRSLPAKDLAKEASVYCSSVSVAPSPHAAVARALEMAGDDCAICAFGSLYLLGDITSAWETLR